MALKLIPLALIMFYYNLSSKHPLYNFFPLHNLGEIKRSFAYMFMIAPCQARCLLLVFLSCLDCEEEVNYPCECWECAGCCQGKWHTCLLLPSSWNNLRAGKASPHFFTWTNSSPRSHPRHRPSPRLSLLLATVAHFRPQPSPAGPGSLPTPYEHHLILLSRSARRINIDPHPPNKH
jgi:hypothetical protein